MCDEDGPRLVLVIIPTRAQLNLALPNHTKPRYGSPCNCDAGEVQDLADVIGELVRVLQPWALTIQVALGYVEYPHGPDDSGPCQCAVEPCQGRLSHTCLDAFRYPIGRKL